MKKILKMWKGNPIWTLVEDDKDSRIIHKWYGHWDNKKMRKKEDKK